MHTPACTQVVINTDQYRGSLAAPAVLRALCAGFAEGRCADAQRLGWALAPAALLCEAQRRARDAASAGAVTHCSAKGQRPVPPCLACSEPPICLSGGLNVDDCASGTDTCWRGAGAGGQPLSACVDTFRGYVCRCPQGEGGLTLCWVACSLLSQAGSVADPLQNLARDCLELAPTPAPACPPPAANLRRRMGGRRAALPGHRRVCDAHRWQACCALAADAAGLGSAPPSEGGACGLACRLSACGMRHRMLCAPSVCPHARRAFLQAATSCASTCRVRTAASARRGTQW